MKKIAIIGITIMMVMTGFFGIVSAGENEKVIEGSPTTQKHVSYLCSFMLCGEGYLSVDGRSKHDPGCHLYWPAREVEFNMTLCCIHACSFLRNPAYSWCCTQDGCEPFWGYGTVKYFWGFICVHPQYENRYTMCGWAFSVTYNGECP